MENTDISVQNDMFSRKLSSFHSYAGAMEKFGYGESIKDYSTNGGLDSKNDDDDNSLCKLEEEIDTNNNSPTTTVRIHHSLS